MWPELTAETVLPQLFGSPAERQALQQLVMEFSELFGPAPKGGSKLRPMSIRLKEGIELPQPSPAHRVPPAVLQEIAEDTKLRMDNGWLIEAPVGGGAVPLCISCGSNQAAREGEAQMLR